MKLGDLLAGTGSALEREFERQWGDLATYNSEVARGIVHTAEWDAKMAEKQKAYNEQIPGSVWG